MKLDDQRKTTSRLNALKSTGPRTPDGKRASSLNASTHGAYAASIVLPGEKLEDYDAMIEAHFLQYNPDSLIARSLVSQMATTLWRLNRMAPAEGSLIQIQLNRMRPLIHLEFEGITSAGLYALAVSSLDSQGGAQSQLLRQERRLLTQYQKLREIILSLPNSPPPAAPDHADFQPSQTPYTPTTADQQPAVDQVPNEQLAVETKLNSMDPETPITNELRFRSPIIPNTIHPPHPSTAAEPMVASNHEDGIQTASPFGPTTLSAGLDNHLTESIPHHRGAGAQ